MAKSLALQILISAKDAATSVIGRVAEGVAKIGVAASAALAALGGFLSARLFGDSVAQAQALEEQMGRLRGVIEATGGAAGLTADEIDAMARRLDEATLGSASGLRAAAAELLTFKAVGKDVFERTLELAQDLSSAGFGSVESAAVQLGKALQDPAQGLTALTRVGVTFSRAQQEMVTQMLRVGDTAGAQAVILDAVARQVGGVARRMGTGLSGALDLVAKRFVDLKEQLGTAMLPVLQRVQERLADLYARLRDSGAITRLGEAIAEMAGQVVAAGERLVDSIDLEGLARRIGEFTAGTQERIRAWGERLATVMDGGRRAVAALEAVWLGLRQAVELAAAGIAGAMSLVAGAWATAVEGAAALGLASEQAALRARAAQESLAEAARAYRDASVQHWQEAGEAARTALLGVGAAAQQAAAQTQAAATEMGLSADELDRLGESASYAAQGQAALAASAERSAAASAEAARATAAQTQAERERTVQAALAVELGESEAAILERLTDQRARLRAAILAETAAGRDAAPLLEQYAELSGRIADAATAAAAAVDRQVAAIREEAAIAQQRIGIEQASLQLEQQRASARQDQVAATRISIELMDQEVRLAQVSADAKRAEAAALAEKARLTRIAAEATGGYAAEERDAVAALERAAEAARLEAQALDIGARAKREALVETERLARQQQVLGEAMRAAGIQGVDSMEAVRAAIARLTTSGELEALGDALREAFAQGVLGAEEYQQALEEVRAKQGQLKEESRKVVVDQQKIFEQIGNDYGRFVALNAGLREIPGALQKAWEDYVAWMEENVAHLRPRASAPTRATTRASAAPSAPAPARAPAVERVASPAPPTTHNVSIQIEGVLDVNDRVTLESLARKLKPVLADLARRGVA